jgi:hypothetical protein
VRPKSSNKSIVYDAICRLFLTQQRTPVSVQKIISETGMKGPVLKDHFNVLVDDGLICRVERGLYIPVDAHDARPMSLTFMPNGAIKIEAGDEILNLNPAEFGLLASQLRAAGASDGHSSSAVMAASQHTQTMIRRLHASIASMRDDSGVVQGRLC